jgi:co-chaperonin GroES (HSP10)
MWTPVGHRVLVLPDKQPDKIGSLFVPDNAKERRVMENIFGEIIAVGPNAWKAFDDGKPWAKVGDRVAFAKYAGFNLEDAETKVVYRLLNDEDIVSTWNGKNKE